MQFSNGKILENTYEILEELNSGGAGIVYRARHLRLDTDVVVKKIKAEVIDKIRIRQEADILKQLKHPYLPRVYDFIETPDGVYTVMDFIQGENLQDAVKKHGKFSQKEVHRWAEQLGKALSYLHSQKPPIIHSDIKPANIMLTLTGDICLIDFNISLAMGKSMEAAIGISAGFSPPEQYRDPTVYDRMTHSYTGVRDVDKKALDTDKTEVEEDDATELIAENDKTELIDVAVTKADTGSTSKYCEYIGRGIDVRSDIYSLGCTLYYLLTGIEPGRKFEDTIPIGKTKIQISEGMEVIIEKMMELSPKQRYQNGTEFYHAIHNCYKLDKRYKTARRNQTGLQLGAMFSMAAGLCCIITGMGLVQKETRQIYYDFLAKAEYAVNQAEYDSASEYLAQAQEKLPLQIEAYADEMYMLYVRGQYEDCIARGKELIEVQPFQVVTDEDGQLYGDIYYVMANSYYEQEEYGHARKMLACALEYNKENSLYYRDYAIILARLGYLKEAEAQLERAIHMGLAQDSIYMAQGEILHGKAEYEAAILSFEKAIELTADKHMKKRAVLLCADAYQDIGNPAIEQEIAFLKEYTDQFDINGNMVLLEYLADAYIRKAQLEEDATQCYEQALELFLTIQKQGYETYQLQENIAILYENIGSLEEAEAVLMQMLEKYPKRYEVYKRLSYLEADKQQKKENLDRDYMQMFSYYKQAKNYYSEEIQDVEMNMLEQMIKELEAGGWF